MNFRINKFQRGGTSKFYVKDYVFFQPMNGSRRLWTVGFIAFFAFSFLTMAEMSYLLLLDCGADILV